MDSSFLEMITIVKFSIVLVVGIERNSNPVGANTLMSF